MTTSTPNTCQKCGKPIMDGSPRGLCPMCLISAVAKSDEPIPSNAPSPELDDLRPAFPQLEILETLGAGGMGRVYKVRQPNLDRIVALKLLPPAYAADPEWIERFTREARALARLNHPNIVQVYDFGETAPGENGERFPFLLMEFVDGVNLRQALRTGALTAREALTIVPSVCAALQYAHDQGVLHRDIKPENILLDTQGRVKIADFGLAKLGGDSAPGLTLTGTGAQLGTAAYMAPEQIEKPHDVDHRADIYSLGVVFYELLTGELPLGRFPAPSEKAGTDPRLDTIVFRTLEKERDRRFQSATDMRTEVENVANHPAPEPRPAPKYGPDEWMIRCASCGRTGALAAVGGVRMGAASIGKRTLIRCSQCGGMREGIISKLRDLPPGTVPVAPAKPDPTSFARGRKRALIGLWLHLVPIVLAVCFLPLWFSIATATADLRISDRMLFETILPRFGGALAAFLIPSALALVAGAISTLIALIGDRFRARWFFWWNLLLWIPWKYAIVGIPPLIYLLVKWREFFPRPGIEVVSAHAPDAPQNLPLCNCAITGTVLVAVGIPFIVGAAVVVGLIAPHAMATHNDSSVRPLWGFSMLPILAGLVGLLPAIAGTICGWVSLGRIRESAGALRGAGLATFAALFYPAWILVAFTGILFGRIFHTGWPAIVGVVLAVATAVWSARALCRHAERASENTAPRPVRWPWLVGFGALACIILLPALGLLLPYFAARSPLPAGLWSPSAEMADVVTPEAAPFIGRLPEGSIELVAVSRHPSAGEPWWKMDGTPASPVFLPPHEPDIAAARLGERAFEFCFNVSNLPAGTRLLDWEVARSEGWSASPLTLHGVESEPRINRLLGLTARLPAKLNATDIRAGFGFGEWETVFETGPQSVGGVSPSYQGTQWKLGWSRAIETKEGTLVSNWNVKRNRDWESRVVAVKNDGQVMVSNDHTTGQDQTEWRFSGAKMAELKAFQFQVRRVQWIEFRGIKLAPSDVVVKSAATAADFDLHQNMTQKSEDSIEAQWLAGSDSPGWVTARFGDSEQSTQMRRDKDGRYKAQIHARLTRSRKPGWARLELTTHDGAGQKANDDINFEEPPGGWFAKVFADTAKDGPHKRGTIPLLQIGPQPVALSVSNDRPHLEKHSTTAEVATFTMTDVYCVAMDDRIIAVGFNYDEGTPSGPEIFVRSEKLTEPAIAELEEVVSGLPVKRQRRAWELSLSEFSPEFATDSGRNTLRKQTADTWLNKPTTIRVGEEKLIFTVPLADGGEGRAFLSARPRRAVRP